MSTTVSIDGQSYEVPANGERGWGEEVSDILIALANNSLLIKGGSIPLTSEADFGANFGLKSIYFKSRTALPSVAGVLRLANTDSVSWRNGANDDDLDLTVASDRLQYEAVDVPTISSTDVLTNKTIDAALNTLSNIDTTMLAAGVLVTDTGLAGASDLNIPSTLAVKTYIDTQIGDNDDAFEITYTPTTPGDWPDPDPTNSGEAHDKSASRITTNTSDISAHVGNLANPHVVTATQLSLGNVDNTSDADKPVSTATQTALDLKEDDLGNPASDGYVLSSTTGGVRSWVVQSGGGGGLATPDIAGTTTSFEPTIKSSTYDMGDANYTILDTDGYRFFRTNSTNLTADRTATLPTASANTGRRLLFKKNDTSPFAFIIDGEGGELIDGETTVSLYSTGASLEVESDGDEWFVVASHRNARVSKWSITSSGTVAAGGAFDFDTAVYNEGGFSATGGGAITIPESGFYQVFVQITFASAVMSNLGSFTVRDNTTEVASSRTSTGGSDGGTMNVFWEGEIDKNDTIKIQQEVITSPTQETSSALTFMTISKIK